MKFTKMHGAGNDYVYVDARGQSRDWPSLAVAMSDRHTGVGSDGLILLMESERADFRMRMFNLDGSEGEMCGNGIRCLTSFAAECGLNGRDGSLVRVETAAGVLSVMPIWRDGQMSRACVDMGEPILSPIDIPVVAPGQETVIDYPLSLSGHVFLLTCVSMGNPHAVAFVDEPVEELPLHDIGPLVENHEMFPRRVNFEVVNILDTGRAKCRVWERGSGLTMACGTGACAVVVAARLKGLVADEVNISLPGGDLLIRWPGYGQVVMEGPIEKVFEGEWPD